MLLAKLGLTAGRPYRHSVYVDEKIHETDKYQILCDTLFEDQKALAPPRLRISDDVRLQAERFLSTAGLADRKFIVCVPGGIQNVSIKAWPKDRFAELLAWLSATYGFQILLTGSEAEREILESLAAMMEASGIKAQMWLGRPGGIPLLAAITEKASLYLGNDTGPLHIAAACGIPAVGIYGGGTWPRFTPVGTRALAVVGSMPCFGCYWDCIFGDAPCVRLIDARDVKDAVQRVLGDEKPSSNVCLAASRIGEETQMYLEKIGPYIRETAEDRAARLEAILLYQHQISVMETDQAAERAVHLEAIQDLRRQLDLSEADRAARLEVIHNYQARIDILSRPETAVKTILRIILKKLRLYGFALRHRSFFMRLFDAMVRRRHSITVASMEGTFHSDRKTASDLPIDAPVVEALVIARSLEGELDEPAMVALFESAKNLKYVLCVDPSPADLQSLVMLSATGSRVVCVSDTVQEPQTDILPAGVTFIRSTFARWLIASGQATLTNYDGILMGSRLSEETLRLLKGRLWPHARIFVVSNSATGDFFRGQWGAPHHAYGAMTIYNAAGNSWLDPAQDDSTYYCQPKWPLKTSPIALPSRMPSGRPWPKISVITVTLNQGAFLEETLQSVLSQGYPNLEYIVIDGGSTDATPEILNRYRTRLTCCISEKDRGQSDAINKGFRQATGDILAWLNSDDCYLPGTLWRVAMAFDDYETDMVVGGCALRTGVNHQPVSVHHNAMPVGRVVTLPLQRLLDIDGSWQKGDFFYQPEVFWTHTLWNKSGGAVDEDLFYSMDYELWVRFALNSARVLHIPDALALFRMHENQKTSGEDLPFLPELRRVAAKYRAQQPAI